MEEIRARAVLRVNANASVTDIEAAYENRTTEVRERFYSTQDEQTREEYKDEFRAIVEARRTLMRRLEEQERLEKERLEKERLEKERLEAEQRRRRRLLAGGLIVGFACAFALVYFWWQNRPGRLVLNTQPAHAKVLIDGVSRGTTPLSLDGIPPGRRQLSIELEGYQDEPLIVVISPGEQRFFPLVTLTPKKETVATVMPSPTVMPTPTVTPALNGDTDKKYPQTSERVLTDNDVANWDLQYAINEMYAWHGARFGDGSEGKKQFGGGKVSWYHPKRSIPEAEGEFTRIELQNKKLLSDLLDRQLRDRKRHK